LSGKNQFPLQFSWQSSDPRVGFLPINNNTQGSGSVPSGIHSGTMSGTNTIYSQILDVSRMDNLGLEVAWSGTPTGTLSIMTSVSAVNWNALTFNPALPQPSGSAAGYSVSLNQLPFKYILLVYVNSSGTGVLTVADQNKDLN
jgi:hypothetical protein